jgi:hypothetical protein
MANIVQSVNGLVEQSNFAFGRQNQMLQTVSNQNVALEQSVIQLGRTLTALSEELIETNGLSSDNMTNRIRKMQDDNERERIKNMLEFKAIAKAEEVNAQSVVVVEEVLTSKEEGSDPKVTRISEYRILELASQHNDAAIVAKFVGKKTSDAVEVEVGSGTVLLTIKEIYEYAKEVQGGAEAQPTEEKTEETQAQQTEEVASNSPATT